jgi:hypothetical protein
MWRVRLLPNQDQLRIVSGMAAPPADVDRSGVVVITLAADLSGLTIRDAMSHLELLFASPTPPYS